MTIKMILIKIFFPSLTITVFFLLYIKFFNAAPCGAQIKLALLKNNP